MRHRLEAVAGEIPEHLADLVRVGHADVGAFIHGELDGTIGPDLGSVSKQCHALGDHPAHVHGARGTRRGSRLEEKLVESVREPLRLPNDDGQEFLLLPRDAGLREEHLRRATDRAERVANLVSQLGGHLSHRGELLLVPDLLLQTLYLGQVLEDQEEPGVHGRAGRQGRHGHPQLQLIPVGARVVNLQAGEAAARGPHLESGRVQQPRGEDLAQRAAAHVRGPNARGSLPRPRWHRPRRPCHRRSRGRCECCRR